MCLFFFVAWELIFEFVLQLHLLFFLLLHFAFAFAFAFLNSLALSRGLLGFAVNNNTKKCNSLMCVRNERGGTCDRGGSGVLTMLNSSIHIALSPSFFFSFSFPPKKNPEKYQPNYSHQNSESPALVPVVFASHSVCGDGCTATVLPLTFASRKSWLRRAS